MLQHLTEQEIQYNTAKLMGAMEISNCKNTVSSIGAILLAFKDNLAIEDQYKLLIAQGVIANLDLNHQQNILRAMKTELEEKIENKEEENDR